MRWISASGPNSTGTISPARAASGIADFDELLERAARDAPEHRLVTLDDVGAYAAFLVSDAAKSITGDIAYVDAGYHVVA